MGLSRPIPLTRAIPVLIVVFIILFFVIAPLKGPDVASGAEKANESFTRLRRPQTSAVVHAILTDKEVSVPKEVIQSTGAGVEHHESGEVSSSSSSSSSSSLSVNGNEDHFWLQRLRDKLGCIQAKKGAFFLYHARKTGGTTLRELLGGQRRRYGVPLFELEGTAMSQQLLNVRGLFKVTSIRDPIERIISLYWYEHVAWHMEVKREPHMCKPFLEWVENWVDSSAHKKSFLQKNPGTNYVEVENYFTKGLVGWGVDVESTQPVGRAELEKAKRAVDAFDLVFVAEWGQGRNDTVGAAASQRQAFEAVLPGSSSALEQQLVMGSSALKEKWAAKLMPSGQALESVLHRLRVLNAIDLDLYHYAKAVAQRRQGLLVRQALRDTSAADTGTASSSSSSGTCPRGMGAVLPETLRKKMGLFRPPGHKD